MNRRKKKLKRLVSACGVLAVFMACLVGWNTARAAVSDDTPVDFVLVLDCSGSLNESDPDELSVSAAKMFVDMLPAENARLSVIAFGENYGSEAYPVASGTDDASNYSKNRVKEVFPLQNITGQEEKEAAKATIEAATEEPEAETYTPIGYALEAACSILEQGGTAPDSASIILLSDGRVSGQGEEDKYNEGYDYYSIDHAVESASGAGWPIYCLELNFDNQNGEDASTSSGKIGHYQMEAIPSKTDAAHIELHNPTEAQNAFAEIFAKFFDAEPTVATGTIQGGQVSLDFEIGEMIAETNLTLTGKNGEVQNIEDIQQIVIRNSEGKETTYNKSITEDNRIITFGDKYITAKLMTPRAGSWNITAYGTDGVEIGLYAVSIREMNLQLNALSDRVEGSEATLPKGSVVDFTASYIYNGSTYSSATVYRESKAYLVIAETGQTIEMTGGDDNYRGTITFSDSGTYTITAYVESELFRNDRKESGSYTFQVGNIPLTLQGTIPDSELAVGASMEIDCSQYFLNEDSDRITYKVNADQTSGLTWEVSETGLLYLSAGGAAGTYPVTINANDGNMEQDVSQSFNLTIVNQPLKLTGGSTVEVNFSYNAGSLPSFIRSALHIGKEQETEFYWADHFTDPDGIPAKITVTALEESDAVTMEQEEEKMVFTSTGKGNAVYEVKAVDANDSSVEYTVTVKVSSMNARALLWECIKIPVFVLLAVIVIVILLLITAFGGRKIYGVWDISCGSNFEEGRKLGATKSGKKAKCRLDDLLEDLDMMDGFQGVTLSAGNNFTKSVFVKGLGKMDEIYYNGSELQKKPARLKIGKGQSLTIENDGCSVTLERH